MTDHEINQCGSCPASQRGADPSAASAHRGRGDRRFGEGIRGLAAASGPVCARGEAGTAEAAASRAQGGVHRQASAQPRPCLPPLGPHDGGIVKCVGYAGLGDVSEVQEAWLSGSRLYGFTPSIVMIVWRPGNSQKSIDSWCRTRGIRALQVLHG